MKDIVSRRRFIIFLFALFIFILVILVGCSDTGYTWGWYEVLPITPQGKIHLKFLVGGFLSTLRIAIISIAISIFAGLFISLPGLSKKVLLRTINRVYVEAFRAIPPLVMILWVYYGLPVLLGIGLDPFPAGIVALALCDSAFEAEIFRGGFNQ